MARFNADAVPWYSEGVQLSERKSGERSEVVNEGGERERGREGETRGEGGER